MLILVDKFSHTVGGLVVGLFWVGFGVLGSELGVSNWGGRCKTFLLPIPYVWEIRPALLGLGRSYLILKVTDHRSPTLLVKIFLWRYSISSRIAKCNAFFRVYREIKCILLKRSLFSHLKKDFSWIFFFQYALIVR